MDYRALFLNSDSFNSHLMSSVYGCLIVCLRVSL